MKTVDGVLYEGDWLNNQFHGLGKFSIGGCLEYEGRFVHGRYDGRCTVAVSNGELNLSFSGLCKNNIVQQSRDHKEMAAANSTLVLCPRLPRVFDESNHAL